MSEIKTTENWFVTAGQMPEVPTLDPRQVAFYLGMKLEELAEQLNLVFDGNDYLVARLNKRADDLKRGEYDAYVERALKTDPQTYLDGDLDQIWVSIGSARAQGADVQGAYAEIARANYDKFPGGVVNKDANGKVIKPEGWRGPDLTNFIHPSLK